MDEARERPRGDRLWRLHGNDAYRDNRGDGWLSFLRRSALGDNRDPGRWRMAAFRSHPFVVQRRGCKCERRRGNGGVCPAGTFTRICRAWKKGDVVEVSLPSKPVVTHWQNDSIAVMRGPLLYSLKIDEKEKIVDASRWGKVLKDAGGVLRDKELGFPMKELRPATRWNYALVADGPDGGIVFGEHGRGLERYLTVKSVRTHYAGWGTMSATAPARAEDPPPCPVPRSAVYGTPTEVRLVPIAFTQLRITLFPWTHACVGAGR